MSERHFCPVCGSLMGFTHQPGDVVVCSWSNYDDPDNLCAKYGHAYHGLPDPDGQRHPTGRLWERAVPYTGEHEPKDAT